MVIIALKKLTQSVLPLSKLVLLGIKGNRLSLESLRKLCNALPKLLFLCADFSAEDHLEAVSLI